MKDNKKKVSSIILFVFFLLIIGLLCYLVVGLIYASVNLSDSIVKAYEFGRKADIDILVWDCPYLSAYYNCPMELSYQNSTGLYCNNTILCEREWEGGK